MSKVIPYIIKGSSHSETIRNVKYQIWGTKQEDAFRVALRQPYVVLFDNLLAENEILRTFFFLERGLELRLFLQSLSVPLFIDPDADFLDSINTASIKEATGGVVNQIEEITKDFKSLSTNIVPRFLEICLKDPEVRRALQQAKGLRRRTAEDILSSALSRHEDKFEGVAEDFLEMLPKIYSAQFSLLPLLEAYQNIKKARKNYENLSFAFDDFNERVKFFFDSIGMLVTHRVFKIRTRSTCLECRLRRGLEPFILDMIYPRDLMLPTRCNKCGGKTILHNLIFEVPISLMLLMEENRIAELAIGYTLAKLDEIKKVYIHKNVQITEDGEAKPRSEIDVLAITKDNRVIIIEVTTIDDDPHIHENINAKIENLKKNKIPYDLMLYVTTSKNKYVLQYGSKNRILGIKHIPNIDEHVKAILKGEY